MTQDQSAKWTFDDGYHTASLYEFFLIGGKLYELRNEREKVGQNAESARQFIKKWIRGKWLNTQTRIYFKPRGEDEIIHNY
ncbi:hypothetical protein J4461_00235 [Candidatus Pacearchaeota archaeon]|nr:hypothetical protein [Candidatus Pacearchaeota archaeon]